MGRPRKFANKAEKQADYRKRVKIEAERQRAFVDGAYWVIAAARVSGLVSATMTGENVLDFVAGRLMDDMTHKEVLQVNLARKAESGRTRTLPDSGPECDPTHPDPV